MQQYKPPTFPSCFHFHHLTRLGLCLCNAFATRSRRRANATRVTCPSWPEHSRRKRAMALRTASSVRYTSVPGSSLHFSFFLTKHLTGLSPFFSAARASRLESRLRILHSYLHYLVPRVFVSLYVTLLGSGPLSRALNEFRDTGLAKEYY